MKPTRGRPQEQFHMVAKGRPVEQMALTAETLADTGYGVVPVRYMSVAQRHDHAIVRQSTRANLISRPVAPWSPAVTKVAAEGKAAFEAANREARGREALGADGDYLTLGKVFTEEPRSWRVYGPEPGRMRSLAPVRETEAWLLADRTAWRTVPGANLSALPQRPADVERIADPKFVLDAVLPSRVKRRQDYFDYMGQNVDLDVLAQVPAYAAWTVEAEGALKGLGYL